MELILTLGIAITLQILLVSYPVALALVTLLARRMIHPGRAHTDLLSGSRWRKGS